MSSLKVGIMGGSFNPVHNGHLTLARGALDQLSLDQVWFMPNRHPVYKDASELALDKHREAMVRLAIEGSDRFAFSDEELKRDGVTYTSDTLRILHDKYPDYIFYFLMGEDSLLYFDHWHEPDVICSLARIAVMRRGEGDDKTYRRAVRNLEEKYGIHIYEIDCPRVDISSSEIRKMAGEKKDIGDFVPYSVLKYINDNNLYGDV